MTLSRRRLALIGVAAAVALAVGFLAAKLYGPGSHPATTAGPSAATTTPAAPSTAATTPAPAPAGPSATATATGPAAAAGSASPAPPLAAGTPVPGPALPTSAPTVSLREPRTGFQISYPRAWARLTSKDPTVPLLLTSTDGVSLQVRAVQLPQPISGPRLARIRDATGLIIHSRPGVQVVAGPRLFANASLPGFLYIYTIADPLSHQRIAHSQMSLFAGRRMFTLVFQTARAADLPRFAMLFDKITASFRAI